MTLLTTATAWAEMTGTGTADDPFVINTPDDWATFAANVNAGTDADKCYILSDTWDNSASAVTVTVGTQTYPFKGSFNGNGRTLTVNLNETSTQGTAPFREISGGAVISNLTVVGSVTGTTHAAGLVGFSREATAAKPNTVENCTVAASITVNVGDNKHMGGVVGHGVTSYLTIKNTVFSGTMTSGGNYAGGLMGWCDGNVLTIANCLFKGSYSGGGQFHPIGVRDTSKKMTLSVSDAYYTAAPTLSDASHIVADGCQVLTAEDVAEQTNGLYVGVTAADGQQYYIRVSVSGLRTMYAQGEALDYELKTSDGTVLAEGADYQVTLTDGGGNVVTSLEQGDYTITFTPASGSQLQGTYSSALKVLQPISAGSGTEADPYIISTTGDLDLLAISVNAGWDTSGKYFKLANDLTYGDGRGRGSYYNDKTSADNGTNFTPIGGNGSTTNVFKGHFDGGGHTIQGIIYDLEQPYDESVELKGNNSIGLFGFVASGATVTNLTLDNSYIAGGGSYIGGIAGRNSGTISNCHVGNGTIVMARGHYCEGIGGIAGFLYDGTVANCVSEVITEYFKITAGVGEVHYAGGIVGWLFSGTVKDNLVVNADVSTEYRSGAIVGCRWDGRTSSAGTLTNNLYYKSWASAKGHGVSADMGCGTGPMDRTDVTDNNGAVRALCLVRQHILNNQYVNNNVRIVSSEKANLIVDNVAYYVAPVEADKIGVECSVGYSASFTQGSGVLDFTKVGDGLYQLDVAEDITYVSQKKIVDLEGNGTEDTPFLIASHDDWLKLRSAMANGETFKGWRFKMTADVETVGQDELIGTADTPFAGIFDGGGYTLTVQLGDADNYSDSQYLAPFSFVDGATFSNLTVDGGIYAGNMFTGGIVGQAKNNCAFTNCHVSVTIAANKEGDGTHGGFVGQFYNSNNSSAGLTFTDCWFDGKMLGAATHSCGGFVGYSYYGDHSSFSNCLFAPEELTISSNNSATFTRLGTYNPKFTKAYYATPLSNGQGNMVYTSIPDGDFCSQVTAVNGQVYYSALLVDGVKELYERSIAGAELGYTVKGADGTAMTLGKDYTQTVRNSNGDEVTTLSENGDYTVTLTATADGACFGSKTFGFTVYCNWPNGGTGTEADPFIVASVDDLNLLMELVKTSYNQLTHKSDYNFKGKYFKQTADIDYSDVEKDESGCNFYSFDDYRYFSGTYDGGGHTIGGIVTKIRKGDACGVFSYLEYGGCVKNLTVTNSTFTADCSMASTYTLYTGGIAGYLYDGSSIDNCHVTNSVYILAGDKARYHGGIAGFINDKCVVSNCTSAAHVHLTEGTEPIDYMEYFGGIVGINNRGEVRNCLYLGGDVNAYEYYGAIVGDNTYYINWIEYNSTVVRNFYCGGDVPAIGRYQSLGPHDVYGACRAVCLDELPEGVDEIDYLEHDGKYYVRAGLLLDAHDNAALIAANQADDVKKYTLKNRNMVKDGKTWNTLCLPFDVTIAEAIDLKGAEARRLLSSAYDESGRLLSLNYSEPVEVIEAGKPYIVKLDGGLNFFQYDWDRYWSEAFFDGDPTKTGSIPITNYTWPVIFYTSGSVKLTGYKLYGGSTYSGIPTKWELKAKVNSGDEWTVIDSRDTNANPADALPREVGAVKEYTLATDKQGMYRYFNLYVTGVINSAAGTLRLGEIELVGDCENQLIINPTFEDVTITATEPAAEGDGMAAMQGTYSPVGIGSADDVLDLDCLTMFAVHDEETELGAFRGYVQLDGARVAKAEEGICTHNDDGTITFTLPVIPTVDYERTLAGPTDEGDATVDGQPASLYTVCLPFVPETDGLTYYTLSGVDGHTLTFDEVAEPVANTPYLVSTTSTEVIRAVFDQPDPESPIADGGAAGGYTLKGTFTDMANADAQGLYILQNGARWGRVPAGNDEIYIPAFRAYIEGPANGTRMLGSAFAGGSTTVSNLRLVDRDGTVYWYDLNGRRISQPSGKGVFIDNGKKVIK